MTAPGPLRAVLAAFENGAASLDDVSATTGLRRDVVDAAVAHLVRIGRLTSESLAGGCPSGGCGGCPSGGSSAGACGTPRAARPSGPVLVTLSRR